MYAESSNVAEKNIVSAGFPSRLQYGVALAACMLLISPLYFLRLDQVVGQVRDDAWYVLLAQSLATGQGYQLINAPLPGILPSYPPAFPFLLSLLLRGLPANVEALWWLKVISILAMLALGGATYFYLARVSPLPAYLIIALSAALTLMPAFVFLATSTVMSECVFTLGQLLTVLVIEKAVRATRQQTLYCLLAALLGSFTFLTRSIAVGLLVAVVLYLLKARQRQAALIFVGGVACCLLPWLLHARLHAPTLEQKQMHGGNILYSYGEQLWMKRAGDAESGTETWRDLPVRVRKNFYNILAHDLGGLVLPSFLRGAAESGEEVLGLGELKGTKGTSMGQVTATHWVSFSVAALALLGFGSTVRRRITLAEILLVCSLALIVIWPWFTFRFVLPLAPFLLHYILLGWWTAAHWLKQRGALRDEWLLARVFLLCVLALYGYDHWGYLQQRRSTPEAVTWLAENNEVQAVLGWAKTHLPPEALVATDNPAQFFLYTQRQAVALSNPRENWARWQQMGVRYLVVLSSYSSTVLDDRPQDFPVIYATAPGRMRIIDLGPPTIRTALQ